MEYSLNNVYVKKALEIGSQKSVKQLFFAKHVDGKFEIRGDLDKLSVLKQLEMEVNMEEALKCKWLVKRDPKFPKTKKYGVPIEATSAFEELHSLCCEPSHDQCGSEVGQGQVPCLELST